MKYDPELLYEIVYQLGFPPLGDLKKYRTLPCSLCEYTMSIKGEEFVCPNCGFTMGIKWYKECRSLYAERIPQTLFD